jgi:putative polyhydroxyalkanoate system protein
MADIRILKDHAMDFGQARQAALNWADQAEKKFAMTCSYSEGDSADELSFSRSGVSGTLTVTERTFELQAKLGFLLSAFKERIENEINANLDALLAAHRTASPESKAG